MENHSQLPQSQTVAPSLKRIYSDWQKEEQSTGSCTNTNDNVDEETEELACPEAEASHICSQENDSPVQDSSKKISSSSNHPMANLTRNEATTLSQEEPIPKKQKITGETTFITAVNTLTPQSATLEDPIELQMDVLDHLLEKEKEKRLENANLYSSFESAYKTKYRGQVTKWVVEVGEDLHLQQTTYHTAVKLYDRYMSLSDNIPRNQYQKYALVCLILAIKLEETIELNYEEMCSFAANAFSIEEILACEVQVLNCLQFVLYEVTPAHFFEIFLEFAFTKDDLSIERIQQNLNSLVFSSMLPKLSSNNYFFDTISRTKIQKLSRDILNHALLHTVFTEKYLPSEVALAALVGARAKAQLSHFPSNVLQLISYCNSDVKKIKAISELLVCL